MSYSRSVGPFQPRQRDNVRTSSVYSQPNTHILQEEEADEESQPLTRIPQEQTSNIRQRASSQYSTVSPLASPRNSGELGTSGSPDVSPVEPPPDVSNRFASDNTGHKSQLPVLRKLSDGTTANITTFSNSPGWRRTNPDKGEGPLAEMRWDDYSGEPTTSESGKKATVKPSQTIETQYPDLKEKTKQILAGLRERDPAKRKLVNREVTPTGQDPLDNPAHREPWKGASGRTTLVDPVRNTRAARLEPLKIPNNSKKRVEPSSAQSNAEQKSTPATVRSIPADEEDEARPSPAPLRLENVDMESPAKQEQLKSLQSPFHSPLLPRIAYDPDAATSGNPQLPPMADNGLPTPTTPPPVQVIQPRIDSLQSSSMASTGPTQLPSTKHVLPKAGGLQLPLPAETEQDPLSRFSWTTYATTVHDSPPTTPRVDPYAPPVPRPPNTQNLLVMRSRPIPARPQTSPTSSTFASNSYVNVVSRKPPPTDRRRASTIMMTGSKLDKCLPQCPPEMQAVDKISSLEARMEEFARRKRNINKLITQLTSGPQPSAMAFDFKTREELKKTTAGLKNELAEVVQEEHDVGIQLHRAQKKRDREALYENPTGLWIKRVTG